MRHKLNGPKLYLEPVVEHLETCFQSSRKLRIKLMLSVEDAFPVVPAVPMESYFSYIFK